MTELLPLTTIVDCNLQALDALEVDTVVCFASPDDPFAGFTELVDWRLGGRLARAMRDRVAPQSAAAPPLLTPGSPGLPKVLRVTVVGSPERTANAGVWNARLAEISEILKGLGAKRFALEPPVPVVALLPQLLNQLAFADSLYLVDQTGLQKTLGAIQARAVARGPHA